MPTLIVKPIAAACWVSLANGDMLKFFESGMHATLSGAYGAYAWSEIWCS